jgi:transmembrane protein TMEM260 (protein O-mannosyltransferase)
MGNLSKTKFSLIVFAITLLVYAITMAPGLMFTDSGELAGVCSTLGIAHPTGYPLFTILGHLWTQLPLPMSDVASLNLFAAVCTAAAMAMFFNVLTLSLEIFRTSHMEEKTEKKRGKSKKQTEAATTSFVEISDTSIKVISFAVALFFGFSQLVWTQAVSIEVYSLQLIMINLIIWSMLKAITQGEQFNKYFLITALFLGLGFANHMTTLLLVPGIFYLYFFRPGEKANFSGERIKQLAILLIPFAIGLSLYLYLPLRAATFPDFNWGWVSRNMDKFLYHVQGKQYQIWMFSGSDVVKDNLYIFFNSSTVQLLWVGIVFFAVGIFYAIKRSKRMFAFWLIIIVSCIVYSMNYNIHDIETYFLTAFMGIFVFIAFAFASRQKCMLNIKALDGPYRFLIFPILALVLNFGPSDKSNDYAVEEFTDILIENLDENAIIISAQWDFWVSAFWYKQQVEGIRPDVVVVEKELLRRTWYHEQLYHWYPDIVGKSKPIMDDFLVELERFESGSEHSPQLLQKGFEAVNNSFIDLNIDERPIYITLDVLQTEPGIAKGYVKQPQGFALKILKEENKKILKLKEHDLSKFINSIEGKDDNHLYAGIKEAAALGYLNCARYSFMMGDLTNAVKYINLAYSIAPDDKNVQAGMQQVNQALGK